MRSGFRCASRSGRGVLAALDTLLLFGVVADGVANECRPDVFVEPFLNDECFELEGTAVDTADLRDGPVDA